MALSGGSGLPSFGTCAFVGCGHCMLRCQASKPRSGRRHDAYYSHRRSRLTRHGTKRPPPPSIQPNTDTQPTTTPNPTHAGVWKKLWLLCASFLLIPGHPFLLISASVANPSTATAASSAPQPTTPVEAAAAGEATVPPTAPGGNKFQSAIKGLQQRQQDVRTRVWICRCRGVWAGGCIDRTDAFGRA